MQPSRKRLRSMVPLSLRTEPPVLSMQAVSDLRALAAALRPAAPCSPAERRSFLVAAAAAHTRQLRAQERNRTADAQVRSRGC